MMRLIKVGEALATGGGTESVVEDHQSFQLGFLNCTTVKVDSKRKRNENNTS